MAASDGQLVVIDGWYRDGVMCGMTALFHQLVAMGVDADEAHTAVVLILQTL